MDFNFLTLHLEGANTVPSLKTFTRFEHKKIEIIIIKILKDTVMSHGTLHYDEYHTPLFSKRLRIVMMKDIYNKCKRNRQTINMSTVQKMF